MSPHRCPQALRPAPAGAALAVLLAALIALWAPPRAAAAADVPQTFFGVSGRHLDNQDFKDLQTAGVGTYRTLFNFSSIKRKPSGAYDWSRYDRLVGQMARRNIRVLPLLYGSPSWLYPRKTIPPIYTAAARNSWSRFLVHLVKRYGPNGSFWRLKLLLPYRPITAWQVWNEPNSPSFWAPGPSPGQYARLAHLSADAIHRVDPKAQIISAGLVADPAGAGAIPGDRYLASLAASKAVRESIDAYGYHPYARNAPAVRARLRAARLALRAHGEGTVPIWVTEFGWGSGSLIDRLFSKTVSGQARALDRTYRTVLASRHKLGIERMLWYNWRDQPDPLCIWCRSAGLLERSHGRKPSFAAFRSLTGS